MSASSSSSNRFLSRLREALLNPERWRAAFTHNLPLKLLSLVIAFGLWSFVNFGERDTEEALKVPLELRNIPASLVITSPRVDFIDVRVMGPRTLLGRIDRSRLSIPLDLNGVRPGPAVFRVASESLNLPRGVRVVRINPAVVTLDLEKVGRKVVPVQLRLDGDPPAGFKVVSIRVNPESVEVTGPASDVKDIEFASTGELQITDAEVGVIERELALEPIGDYLSYSVPRVNVEVRVEEVLIRREVEGVPIHIRNAPNEASVTPTQAKVAIRGPKRLVSSLTPDDITLFVDAASGDGQLKIEVEPAPPLELVSLDPKSAKVTFPTPSAAEEDSPTVAPSAAPTESKSKGKKK